MARYRPTFGHANGGLTASSIRLVLFSTHLAIMSMRFFECDKQKSKIGISLWRRFHGGLMFQLALGIEETDFRSQERHLCRQLISIRNYS